MTGINVAWPCVASCDGQLVMWRRNGGALAAALGVA